MNDEATPSSTPGLLLSSPVANVEDVRDAEGNLNEGEHLFPSMVMTVWLFSPMILAVWSLPLPLYGEEDHSQQVQSPNRTLVVLSDARGGIKQVK